jgi:uncharacterized membrane protein YgcG
MDIKTLWYELSPYVYLVAGVASIFLAASRMAMVPGILLTLAAITILRLRWRYRNSRVVTLECSRRNASDGDGGKGG